MNNQINSERVINDLGIKIAQLIVDNSIKDAQLADAYQRIAELESKLTEDAPAIDDKQDMNMIG